MSKSKKQTYLVYVTLKDVYISKEVHADNFEAALEEARQLRMGDFVEFTDGVEWVDGHCEVEGVMRP